MKAVIYCRFLLGTAGATLLLYCGAVTVRARLFQESQSRTYVMRPQDTGLKPTQCPQDGSVIARLEIPALKMSSMVVEGISGHDLSVAPGHIPGTSLPGEQGNVVIAGHRDTFFWPLQRIRTNHVVTLTTSHGERRYRVVSTQVVDAHDVGVLHLTSRDTLTLVTCYPFDYIGHASKRFIVHADLMPATLRNK